MWFRGDGCVGGDDRAFMGVLLIIDRASFLPCKRRGEGRRGEILLLGKYTKKRKYVAASKQVQRHIILQTQDTVKTS